jgi:Fungal fucose-specific lectin
MAGYVSAVSWFDGKSHLRVYKGDGNNVTEQCWDGSGWYKGGFSQKGTTVGATSWLDGGGQIHIRVYVGSGTNAKITEYCWDKDKWYVGGFSATGDGAAATCWMQGSQAYIRVYVRDDSGKVTEYCWDKDRWYVGGYPS